MAFAAISSLFSTGSLLNAPVSALSLIPLLAIGINYYRSQSDNPEGRPIDAQKVSLNSHFLLTFDLKSLAKSNLARIHLS